VAALEQQFVRHCLLQPMASCHGASLGASGTGGSTGAGIPSDVLERTSKVASVISPLQGTPDQVEQVLMEVEELCSPHADWYQHISAPPAAQLLVRCAMYGVHLTPEAFARLWAPLQEGMDYLRDEQIADVIWATSVLQQVNPASEQPCSSLCIHAVLPGEPNSTVPRLGLYDILWHS
jgi:hypothetical protein